MRTFALTSAAALCLLIGACSKDEPTTSGTTEPVGNTQLRIDTNSGEVSYENEGGGSSTSITVGGDDEEKKND